MKQNNFLLSREAKALRPADAERLRLDEAYERFKDIRWGWTDGRPVCPHCESERVYEMKTRAGFKCAKCSTKFSVTSGTAFASRKLPYRDILTALSYRVHETTNAHQLSKALGVQYKTSVSLFSRFRIFSNLSAPRPSANRWPFLNSDRNEAAALLLRVNNVVPRELPEQVRGDVAQEMILGILSGEITEDQLAQNVRRYMRKYYASYDNAFAKLSWDAPVPGTDGMRWDDIISTEHKHA